MPKNKILLICGSMNQTTMMHQVSKHLTDYEVYFSAYYSDGIERIASRLGLLDFTVLGGKFKTRTEIYLKKNNLKIDYEGKQNQYELIITCSDLLIPKNIRSKKIVLVQEGMTDPENIFFHLAKKYNFPRYFASTSATGLSDSYTCFCVASEGYKDFFTRKGVKREKMIVTGIPNFDNCVQYLDNDFPHKNYALVCTSDSRETFKFENRKKFILEAKKLSDDKQLLFKLHPNEDVPRAKREINEYAPGSIIYSSGNTNHMIANCDILITKFSSVVYVGLALGKKVYSAFNLDELKKLMPIQNSGNSAKNIATVCLSLLGVPVSNNELILQNKNDKFEVTYQTA